MNVPFGTQYHFFLILYQFPRGTYTQELSKIDGKDPGTAEKNARQRQEK